MEDKPITHILSYRGVEDFPTGYHSGRNRDVVVTGIPIPGPSNPLGFRTVPALLAEINFFTAERELGDNLAMEELARIDEVIVYLGADGARPGYDYVTSEISKNESGKTIRLATCGCGSREKEDFAREHGLELLRVECGGRRALGQMARKRLEARVEEVIR